MKIRNGFVSNSSSSSFLLITSVENHGRVLEQLTDYEKAVITSFAEIGKKELFGRKIVCLEDFSGEHYYTIGALCLDKKWEKFEEKECPEYPEDMRNAAWEKYQKLVQERPEEVLTRNFDSERPEEVLTRNFDF